MVFYVFDTGRWRDCSAKAFAGVVFDVYTRENGGLFRIVYLHLAHISKGLNG